MRCHASDPMEEAIADGKFDAWYGKWVGTAEEKEEFDRRMICPADGKDSS